MRQIRGILKKDFVENQLAQWLMVAIAVIVIATTVSLFTVGLTTSDPQLSRILIGTFVGTTIPVVAFVTYMSGLPFGMIMRDTKVGWIRFLVSVGIPRQRIAQSKLIYCLIVCGIAWLLFSVPMGCYAYLLGSSYYLVIIGYFALLPLSIAGALGGVLLGLTLSPNVAAMLFSLSNLLVIVLAFGANLLMFVSPGNPAGGIGNISLNLILGLALGVLILSIIAVVGLYIGLRHVLVNKDM